MDNEISEEAKAALVLEQIRRARERLHRDGAKYACHATARSSARDRMVYPAG